jgi:branched-chain amino acid transport system permease protein
LSQSNASLFAGQHTPGNLHSGREWLEESRMLFVQQLINGVALGSIYALVALGLSLIWATARLLDFAYGEIFMIAGLVAWTLTVAGGLPIIPSMMIAVLVAAVVGFLVQRGVYMRLANKDHVIVLLATIGMSMVLRDGATKVWGTDTFVFPSPFQGVWVIGDVVIRTHFLFIIGGAAILILVFNFVLKRSRVGLAMRALAENRDVAAMMGVSVLALLAIAFAISYLMGAAAGVLIAPIHYIAATGGTGMMIKGITAAVLGGFGSLTGALLGGLLIGIVEAMSAGFISSTFKDVVVFGIFVAVLYFMPQGLLGKRRQGISEL